jgi:hypothetical protein
MRGAKEVHASDIPKHLDGAPCNASAPSSRPKLATREGSETVAVAVLFIGTQIDTPHFTLLC